MNTLGDRLPYLYYTMYSHVMQYAKKQKIHDGIVLFGEFFRAYGLTKNLHLPIEFPRNIWSNKLISYVPHLNI